jgi:2-methylisocitrate lyase-like PEP mutase family enzyme
VPRPSLARLLARRRTVLAPGAYDALSARMIAQHGFPAVYLTGYGTTASLLGLPDLGLVTLTEMAQVVRNICQVIDVPLIADGEAGFGNAVNAARAVRVYEQAGAAAIHLEDQILPKRARGAATPRVVPAEEHADIIRLAARSRRRDDFLIIGRTDCLEGLGLDEAIRRGNAYRAAGADLVFVHGIATRKELREVGRAVRGPKVVNYSALTLSDQRLPARIAELHAWGYAVVICAVEPLFAAAKAVEGMLRTLSAGGSAHRVRGQMASRGDMERTLERERFQHLEERYLARQ